MQKEIFYSGKPLPKWNVFSSLAVNIFTASILVDYAFHELETPTDWSKGVAAKLSNEEKQSLAIIRAILAHGWVLRDYVLTHGGAEDAVHADWPSLKGWLASLTDEDMAEIVIEGILSNLDYYNTYLKPMDAVEIILEKIGTQEITAERLKNEEVRQNALKAVLVSWGMQDYEEVAKGILNPALFRHHIMTYVTALWEKGLRAEWTEQSRRLEEKVRMTKRLANGDKMSLSDLVIRVTGLEPEQKANELLMSAKELVFVPCLHLDSYLSMFLLDEVCYVLFDPFMGEDSAQARAEDPAKSKSADDFTEMLAVIGDPMRLNLLMLLKERPGLHTGEISEALDVHLSTVSRHCQQLEKSGLIVLKKVNAHKCYSLNKKRLQELGQWLTATFQ